MTQRYRIQFFDEEAKVLAINWVGIHPEDKYECEAGDCRVRAIAEETDIARHNKSHFQNQQYTEPMTLEEARTFIERNKSGLGIMNDCVGLTLEDSLKTVEFTEPVRVRSFAAIAIRRTA